MGAYERGNIARLCKLAPPEIGILTAIAPQHLERFGSIENIAKTKYELIESLPSRWHRDLQQRQRATAARWPTAQPDRQVIRYGLDASPKLDLTARDVRATLGRARVPPGRRSGRARPTSGSGCSASTTSPTSSPRPRPRWRSG